tara:strand:- start:278 stop:2695 length:2418 start_codon:yes stop_codon:yes gene_type:complete
MSYDHIKIENKWQSYWFEKKIFSTEVDPNKPKYYVLDMFPYPSGSGLHVGHPLGYIATDIIARYKRHLGFNVLHPMGWDAFGLPAEQYAIKTGTHPSITTKENIANFKKQIKMLGFSYDWEREINTTDNNYLKWTQWLFIQLFNKGLAYEAEVPVNWCPKLKAVLANEEVIDGKSDIGGHPVFRVPMKQWMLKITDYAESLLSGLDDLDWPNSVKELQKNWIGKSTGAIIKFNINDFNESLDVFTTRHDTIFGATYIVLAPEHPLVEKITHNTRKDIVNEYIKNASKKSDLDRTELNKDKTGEFLGQYAINPVNEELIPIWISDYVIMSYGTGAIMAVPGQDERDYDFAEKYNLPVIRTVQPPKHFEGGAYTGSGQIINSDFLNGLSIDAAQNKILEWLVDNKHGNKKTQYKLRDWLFSRQRYWGEPIPILHNKGVSTPLEVKDLPLTLPKVDKYEPSGTGESPLSTIKSWVEVKDSNGNIIALRETNTMPQWAGSCWYFLRFLDPNNENEAWSKDKEEYWMPVDLYIGGAEHAVLHLLYARFWHHVFFDLGLVSTKEPFKKLFNQGMILGHDGSKMSKSRGNVVNPDDTVKKYGADSMRIYEMFMGPLDKAKPWSTSGLEGCYRFVKKLWSLLFDNENKLNSKIVDSAENKENEQALHFLIKKITENLERLQFNTCVSEFMIFVNHLTKQPAISKSTVETFTIILNPFMPHLSEEIWTSLGKNSELTFSSWPKFNPNLVKLDMRTIGVQVNGKRRSEIEIYDEDIESTVLKKAKDDKKVLSHIEGKVIIKEIYIKNKIVNIVVK